MLGLAHSTYAGTLPGLVCSGGAAPGGGNPCRWGTGVHAANYLVGAGDLLLGCKGGMGCLDRRLLDGTVNMPDLRVAVGQPLGPAPEMLGGDNPHGWGAGGREAAAAGGFMGGNRGWPVESPASPAWGRPSSPSAGARARGSMEECTGLAALTAPAHAARAISTADCEYRVCRGRRVPLFCWPRFAVSSLKMMHFTLRGGACVCIRTGFKGAPLR